MKRSMIITVMIISVLHSRGQNLSFGPTAGIGHSWTSYPSGSNVSSAFHPTFNIGGKMVYSFTPAWGVSGEVKFSAEGQSNNTIFDSRANYLRIPLQAIFFFGKYGDRVRPKVSLGPSFGILVGGKTTTIGPTDGTQKVKTTDVLKTFDFGLTVAGGGNVRIATATWLNLDLAYYHGLINVEKNTTNYKNRNLGINVGVTFPLTTIMPNEWKR